MKIDKVLYNNYSFILIVPINTIIFKLFINNLTINTMKQKIKNRILSILIAFTIIIAISIIVIVFFYFLTEYTLATGITMLVLLALYIILSISGEIYNHIEENRLNKEKLNNQHNDLPTNKQINK